MTILEDLWRGLKLGGTLLGTVVTMFAIFFWTMGGGFLGVWICMQISGTQSAWNLLGGIPWLLSLTYALGRLERT